MPGQNNEYMGEASAQEALNRLEGDRGPKKGGDDEKPFAELIKDLEKRIEDVYRQKVMDPLKELPKPQRVDLSPCAMQGHCYTLIKEVEKYTIGNGNVKNPDSNSRYFVFICSRCGDVKEVRIGLVVPFDRRP